MCLAFAEHSLKCLSDRQEGKEVFVAEMINNGQVWIEMMRHRNLLAYTYAFSNFKEVSEAIENYYLNVFSELHDWFFGR